MNAVMSHPKAKDYRHELRKLFHGPILKDIADQVKVRQQDGSMARYPAWIWKEYLRARFNAGQSTEALLDFEFYLFILQCQAWAATSAGVTFTNQPDPNATAGALSPAQP